ncbi:MAG TPA: DNA adenine methylase [Candidatus Angelobacter sp.]|nr:DNA adenine methylase [Candidatus Angelobacter sp.]
MKDASPLRYPGGKWRLTSFFERLLALNFDQPPTYIEPYAGGASLALSLLLSGKVTEIFLNDLDITIHAFWQSILEHTDKFISLLNDTPVTVTEWKRQKSVYASGLAAGTLKLGFATFFLNRTNHSGILNGGMIGGKRQDGAWKLDARFNRSELLRRIRRIAAYRNQIHLFNCDAVNFVREYSSSQKNLIYLDPPYYCAGQRLYLNAYRPQDHAQVRDRVLNFRCRWIVSYDDVPEIRDLYSSQRVRCINLFHTARAARKGKEVMFFSSDLKIPRKLY